MPLCYVVLCEYLPQEFPLWGTIKGYCVVSCRVVSCRVVSCRVVSCRVVSCRVVSYRIVTHTAASRGGEDVKQIRK